MVINSGFQNTVSHQIRFPDMFVNFPSFSIIFPINFHMFFPSMVPVLRHWVDLHKFAKRCRCKGDEGPSSNLAIFEHALNGDVENMLRGYSVISEARLWVLFGMYVMISIFTGRKSLPPRSKIYQALV